MFSRRHSLPLLAFAALASIASCKRTPPERTPEGTLARLRSSLATHDPPLERVADVRVLTEARVLSQLNDVQGRFGVGVSETGVRSVLAEHAADMDPQQFFAGTLPLLRQGHCEKIADVPLPDIIHPPPEPGEHWPRSAADLQISVARRTQNAVAGDYRCDGGPSFGVVFTHPYPDDGTLRVAFIGPARHR